MYVVDFGLIGILSFLSAAPLQSSEGVDMSSPSPSELNFEDAVSSTTPSLCSASGSFRTLTVPFESPLKISYMVLFIAARESWSMSKISLWPFGSDF
jgi:hypothetical protein